MVFRLLMLSLLVGLPVVARGAHRLSGTGRESRDGYRHACVARVGRGVCSGGGGRCTGSARIRKSFRSEEQWRRSPTPPKSFGQAGLQALGQARGFRRGGLALVRTASRVGTARLSGLRDPKSRKWFALALALRDTGRCSPKPSCRKCTQPFLPAIAPRLH